MAPARDPAFPGFKRTSPINRTCNFWNSNPQYESAEDHANFVEWAIAAEEKDPLLLVFEG